MYFCFGSFKFHMVDYVHNDYEIYNYQQIIINWLNALLEIMQKWIINLFTITITLTVLIFL